MLPRGVKLVSRIVPWPTSISQQARALLAERVDPDGMPLAQSKPLAPDDLEGWRKLQGEAGYTLAALMQGWPAARSSSETVTISGVTVHVATPPDLQTADKRTILDIHGGAFVYGSGEFCRRGGQMAADLHGVRCHAVDYRTPPEHPFPEPLDDCLTVYRRLVDSYGAENVIVIGASAGGNLAAALALRARDEGLPLPAAMVLRTPELDLTESGDSFQVNQFVDVVLVGSLASTINAYAQKRDLRDPYISPLFGDFSKGFPPTYLDAGTRDLFLSNVARMHRHLRRAKIPVELQVHEGMPHGGFGGAPEDAEVANEVRDFVARHWGRKST
jgi:monoterpene epsilon-lactone hydrolase